VNIPFTDTDIQNLANDLALALDNWGVLNTQLTVKMYDAQKAPPSYPLATAVKTQGTIAAATINRDLALCLSFYAGINAPRYRGRLYIPVCMLGSGSTGAFAATTTMNKVMELGPIFAGLGGIDVDWVVFSRADNVTRPVTNYHVDNAWDTMRSRGPRASSRVSATTTEDQPPNLVSLIPGGPPPEA
jgi:hypothetical protein